MKQLYLYILLCCILPISGCHRQSIVADAWPSQPLSHQLAPLDSHIEISTGIPFRSKGELIWEDQLGEQYDSARLAARAERMANEAGYDTIPVHVDDAEWYQVACSASENPLSLPSFSSLYRQTVVIVCVDPLVVAVANLPIGTAYSSKNVNAKPYRNGEFRHTNRNLDGFIVGLKGGVVYGTEIPYGDGGITVLQTGVSMGTEITNFPTRVELVNGAICIHQNDDSILTVTPCE